MNMEEKLRSIPKSYDDFVRYTLECMEEDSTIEALLINQFQIKPDSDVNDITKILCDHRGIGEPIEILEDEDTAPLSKIRVAML